VQHLRPAADSLEDALRGLGAIASTRRRGEELVTLAVGAHGAALERLIGLSPDPQLLEQDAELAELLWVNRPAPPDAEVLTGFAERVDRALAAIGNVGVPGLSELALGLLDTVNELYGAGFARAFELLHDAGHHDAIRAALDDDLVASELVISGMHPDDVDTRARRALDRIGATFAPGGPSVSFSGIDEDGTVRLRVTGQPVRDRWRVALAAERAVAAVTPDAPTVTVDGVDGDDDAPPATDVFIPLGPGRPPAVGSRSPSWPPSSPVRSCSSPTASSACWPAGSAPTCTWRSIRSAVTACASPCPPTGRPPCSRPPGWCSPSTPPCPCTAMGT
jgi:hypothetical protein